MKSKFRVGDKVIIVKPLLKGFHGTDKEAKLLRGKKAVIIHVCHNEVRGGKIQMRYRVRGQPPVAIRACMESELSFTTEEVTGILEIGEI